MGASVGQAIESWKVYRSFLRSDDPSVVAKELATTEENLKRQLANDPLFREAAEAATRDRLPACLDGMDDSIKELWETLSGRDIPEDARQQALLALAHNGKREQQRLFAFGLIQNHFDVLSALRALKISQATYRKWLQEPEFAELIAGVQSAKRQFVEGRLFQLVAACDTKAVLFSAERLMRDDYGAKLEVTGTVNHEHAAIDLSRLPLELRIQVMDALRETVADPDGMVIELSPVEVKRLP
jgi:hypothetical protein